MFAMKNALKQAKTLLSKVLEKVANCILPTLPIVIGVGMLKVVLIFLGPLVLNVLAEDSNTYLVLSFVADAGYYFLPIYVAVSSAEEFKTDKYIAALIGAMLISPAFVEYVESGHALTIFKLPIALTNYGNQIISSIIAVWIMSYVYKIIDSFIIENLKAILTPLITVIVMVPISFCAIGPIGVYLGNKLVDLIMLLKDLGPIGNGIMCAIIPYITLAGLGGANLSAMSLIAVSGCDPILFFSNVIYNNVLGFVTLALYIKNKKSDVLAASITSAVAGTSEPALFGCVINDGKALLSLTIADFLAGLYAGITGVKSYAMASFGIFGIITTIGPDSSIFNAAIAILIGCISGFVLCLLLHTKKK